MPSIIFPACPRKERENNTCYMLSHVSAWDSIYFPRFYPWSPLPIVNSKLPFEQDFQKRCFEWLPICYLHMSWSLMKGTLCTTFPFTWPHVPPFRMAWFFSSIICAMFIISASPSMECNFDSALTSLFNPLKKIPFKYSGSVQSSGPHITRTTPWTILLTRFTSNLLESYIG